VQYFTATHLSRPDSDSHTVAVCPCMSVFPSDSKQRFTTSFFWRKVPESGARSVFPSVFSSVSLVSVCLLDFVFLAVCLFFKGHPHFAVCLLDSVFLSVRFSVWFLFVCLSFSFGRLKQQMVCHSFSCLSLGCVCPTVFPYSLSVLFYILGLLFVSLLSACCC